MLLKSFILLATLCYCDCVVFSSFYAPLFNPKILNYRVDVPFSPDAGKNTREDYAKKFGVRGEKLIADLGNGKGPDGKKVKIKFETLKYVSP